MSKFIRAAVFLGLFLLCSLFWLLVFSVARTFAQPLQGLDILSLAKMNAKMVAEEIDNGTAMGVLDSTFGPVYGALGTTVSSGKVNAYRVHLRDFTCYRNSRCPSGYPAPNDPSPIRAAARRLDKFSIGFPNILCYVSPALEHDVKDRAVVNRWYKILDEVVPQCTPVCSAYTGWCPDKTPRGRTILKEKHGNQGTAAIRSNDGESLFDSNSPVFRSSGTVLSLGWIPEFNGRVSGEEAVPPPLKRINFATRTLVRQAVRVMRPPTPRPEVVGCPPIKEPELGKTNAEYYGVGQDDGRGNKYLFISSRRVGDELLVQKLTEHTVGCLRYYGPFSGGGFRYYIGSCSRQNPVQLMDALGSEWGLLRWKGGCRVFNAIRRQGYYR